MIFELKDTKKAAPLFEGLHDSLIQTCLDGMLGGKIYVTDTEAPRSALAFVAEFAYFAGEPDRELAAFKPQGYAGMVPPDDRWAQLIEEYWPDADKTTRYALKKDGKFDRKKLESFIAAIPDGYELKRIDGDIYDMLIKDEDFDDSVSHFESKEQYLDMGRGFVIMKDGEIVSAASSYTVYSKGLDIQIDTAEAERRKGLATATGAALILSCLEDGLAPRWDAANTDSLHLAEKLGFEFSHEYLCYWVDAIFDRVIKDPDRSLWDSFCGRYEMENESRKVFEILLKDGDLYCAFSGKDGDPLELKLFPVGENEFGFMWADDEIVFKDGALIVNNIKCNRTKD